VGEQFSEYVVTAAIVGILIVLLLLGIQDWLSRRGPQGKVRGVVSGHVQNMDGEVTFTPKIRFTTADGRDVEITDGFGVSKRAVPIGVPRTVTYPLDNPERGRVSHPGKRITMYVVLLAMLAVFVAAKMGVLTRLIG
jgi:hypothetical protein